MKISHKFLIILCMSGTAWTPALAQDVPPAVEAMLSSFEKTTKIRPTFDKIETSGTGTVTISNMKIEKAASGTEPGMNTSIAEVTLSDIKDEGGGLFMIGNAVFTNSQITITDTSAGFTITVPESAAQGWYIQDPASGSGPAKSLNLANRITTGNQSWTINGQAITVDGYEQTWDGDPRTGAGTYAMKVNNIAVPEQVVALGDQTGMMKQLGYGDLSFDLAGNGRVDFADGNYGLNMTFNVSGRDMGAFSFGVAAADVPVAVIEEMQKAGETGTQPNYDALMPQIQNISFSNFKIRFDDASITGKILPMVAAMQGMDVDGFIANASGMIQMGLMQLQNPAFSQQAATAINGFLKSPKSLTIAANPASPVKVSDLMMMNPNAPGEIITRLGVTMSSND